MLNRISDQLLKMFADQLWTTAFSGLMGGGTTSGIGDCLSGLFGSPGGVGPATSAFPVGVYDRGTRDGDKGDPRWDNPHAYLMAPRINDGLASKDGGLASAEFRAILRNGEIVTNEQQQGEVGSLIDRLSAAARPNAMLGGVPRSASKSTTTTGQRSRRKRPGTPMAA